MSAPPIKDIAASPVAGPGPSPGPKSAWSGIKTGLVSRKPHQGQCNNYAALQTIVKRDGAIGMHHFETVRRMGDGDLGVVDLVVLRGTEIMFAMKSIDKKDIEERNKINRVHTEARILQALDHPYCATLHCVLNTPSHLRLVMESCGGGDLYSLMDAQPGNRLSEDATRFYAAEVLLSLQYMHLQGFVYRDLKPENLLIGCDGHIVLTDFDLAYTQGVVKPKVEYLKRVRISRALVSSCASFSFNYHAARGPTYDCSIVDSFLPTVVHVRPLDCVLHSLLSCTEHPGRPAPEKEEKGQEGPRGGIRGGARDAGRANHEGRIARRDRGGESGGQADGHFSTDALFHLCVSAVAHIASACGAPLSPYSSTRFVLYPHLSPSP